MSLERRRRAPLATRPHPGSGPPERQLARRSMPRRSRVNAAVRCSASSSPSPFARRSVKRRSPRSERSSTAEEQVLPVRLSIKACEPQSVAAPPLASSTLTRRRASRAPHTSHPAMSGPSFFGARLLRSMPRSSHAMWRSAKFSPSSSRVEGGIRDVWACTSSPAAPDSLGHRSP